MHKYLVDSWVWFARLHVSNPLIWPLLAPHIEWHVFSILLLPHWLWWCIRAQCCHHGVEADLISHCKIWFNTCLYTKYFIHWWCKGGANITVQCAKQGCHNTLTRVVCGFICKYNVHKFVIPQLYRGEASSKNMLRM